MQTSNQSILEVFFFNHSNGFIMCIFSNADFLFHLRCRCFPPGLHIDFATEPATKYWSNTPEGMKEQSLTRRGSAAKAGPLFISLFFYFQ